MQTQNNSSLQMIHIYSNIDLHLEFFDPTTEKLRPFSIIQKSLSELPFSDADKVTAIIVDDLAELTAIPIGCEHSIVITAKNNLTPLPEHLSNTLIYQQASNEDYQQALEKVFNALIKTYFSTEMFLEPTDLYQSDAFGKGQH
ncbi:hypothetical protein [Acinetobacter colistiniresistens]